MKITDCQPGSGNPTVRDERGAYGNVSYGGTRNPLHIPKGCRTETLCLRLRAPYFYPTSGAGIPRGNSGTWESHLSPGHIPGLGDRVSQGPGGVLGSFDQTTRPRGTPRTPRNRQGMGTRATSEGS